MSLVEPSLALLARLLEAQGFCLCFRCANENLLTGFFPLLSPQPFSLISFLLSPFFFKSRHFPFLFSPTSSNSTRQQLIRRLLISHS